MPRRRPGALRALWRYAPAPPVDGLSRRTGALVHDLERRRDGLWPGAAAAALRAYRDFLRRPGRTLRLVHAGCPCDGCSFEDVAVARALRPHGGRSEAQDSQYLDVASRIRMRPDLVWYGPDSEPAAVADAKDKAEKRGGFPDADLYQMLAHCTASALRRGHLVCAAGSEEPTTHEVRHAGIEIMQHVLPLHLPPGDLLRAVTSLADTVAVDATPEP